MTLIRLCRFLCLLVLLGTLALAGCGRSTATEKPKEAPRVTVAHPLVRDLVDEDDYNGWLVANATQEVRSRVRGHIQKVYFKGGETVKKGDLLFDLDPRPFQVEINQAQANAKALDAQKVAADKDVARYLELIKTGAASKQQLEKSQADAAAYDAQIAAKMEEVKRYQLDLQYAKITAEIGGWISKPNLTEGNLVNAGGSDPLLTTIVAIDPIYVDFNVDERAMQEYVKMSTRRKAEEISFRFGLDTDQGFPYSGKLIFADNKYTEGTGTILIRGSARNEGKDKEEKARNGNLLVPGSRVRVRVPVSEPYRAVVVPDTAVLSDQDRKYLLVVGEENKVIRRDFTPGRLLDDGMRVILPAPDEGKAASDKDWIAAWEKSRVITVGLQRARVGYEVQPQDAQGKSVQTVAAQ